MASRLASHQQLTKTILVVDNRRWKYSESHSYKILMSAIKHYTLAIKQHGYISGPNWSMKNTFLYANRRLRMNEILLANWYRVGYRVFCIVIKQTLHSVLLFLISVDVNSDILLSLTIWKDCGTYSDLVIKFSCYNREFVNLS
jgi:hypothetical protein